MQCVLFPEISKSGNSVPAKYRLCEYICKHSILSYCRIALLRIPKGYIDMRMRYISTFAIPILVASILASCSLSPKCYPEGTISLMLYRPVDFNGHENLYVNQSKTLKGVSNTQAKNGGLTLYKDEIFCSLGKAVRHAIEKEGPYCMGLANVKVTRNYEPGTGVIAVEGNPVYRKH